MNNILLVENRAKQMVIMALNFNIYLDAVIHVATSLQEFKDFLDQDDTKLDLVVSSGKFMDCEISSAVAEIMKTKSLNFPHLVLGSGEGTILLDEKLVIKPVIKEAAGALNLTAKMMASKDFGEYFEIASGLIDFINYAPCSLFILNEANEYQEVYKPREVIKAPLRIDTNVSSKMFVNTSERLMFVNSLTEQNRDSFLDEDVVQSRFNGEVEKLSQSMDDISSKLISGGDNEDIAIIAKQSIQSMIELAQEDIVVKDLVSRLHDSKANFRFNHSQLIIFIGLQVLKKLGRSDEDMECFSKAAFFHDISITTDELAVIRETKELLVNDFSSSELDQIRNHCNDSVVLVQRLDGVDSKTLTIIREHHGSAEGLGFGTKFNGLSYLSKAFIITEHWAQILMFEGNDESFDLEKYKNKFNRIYPGKMEKEFITVLFLIEATELVKSVTDDIKEELINIKGSYGIDNSISHVKGIKQLEGSDTQMISGEALEGESDFQKVDGVATEEESTTKIQGTTEHINDESQLISGEQDDASECFEILGSIAESENLEFEESSPELEIEMVSHKKDPEDEDSDDDGLEDELPKINGEQIINTFIFKTPELSEEIGGEWASSKFLATLMALDTPLTGHPFIKKFNKIARALTESSDFDAFKSSILKICKEIQIKFEEDIKNTINSRDKQGRTKIMITIATKNSILVDYIMGFSPDLKIVDTTGKLALHHACIGSELKIVKAIYGENSAALNKPDNKKRTPLFLAVSSDSLEVVQFLISKEARPKMVSDSGVSCPMIASHNGNLELLKELTANGESLFQVDQKYKTCINYAKQKKRALVLEYLREQGVQ